MGVTVVNNCPNFRPIWSVPLVQEVVPCGSIVGRGLSWPPASARPWAPVITAVAASSERRRSSVGCRRAPSGCRRVPAGHLLSERRRAPSGAVG
eukprot:1455406-Pyramimonas_sp.AAC.1